MADYSGYTPQRQQQRQDPWADAAVGIAKLFMPDQEMQFKARQMQQTEEMNALRLKDYKSEAAARDARTQYDNDRLAEAKTTRAIHEEKGRIMAEAARTGGLTPDQAARLADINSRLGGAAGGGSIAEIYKLTPEGKAAAAAEAEAKIKRAQEKAAAEAAAKATGEKAKADDEYFAGEAKKVREYAPPNDMDLRNAIVARVYGLTRGGSIGEQDINFLIRSARSKKLNGSAEDVAAAVVSAALGNDAASAGALLDANATPDEIEAAKKTSAAAGREKAGSRVFKEQAFKNVENMAGASPGAVVVEGTPDEIRAQTSHLPPGTRVIWRDTSTGRHGGGMVPPANWSFPGQLPASITGGVAAPGAGVTASALARGGFYGAPQIIPANDPRRVLGYFAPWQR